MVQAFREARADLRPHIRSLWFHREAPVRRFERILPQPVGHLIVNLSAPYRLLTRGGAWVGDPFAGAFVSGLQREYLVIENPDELWQCGAEIAPAGFGALTSSPPAELAGRVRDADGLIPGSGEWRARLGAVSDPEVVLDLLEESLATALRPGFAADPVAASAVARLDDDPDLPIGDLARELGVAHSRLIDVVRAATGTTPKAYADLVRFARFLAEIPHQDPAPRWTDLVARTGYHDQAHFIRCFKRYTGYTPSRYLEGIRAFGAEWPAFVPEEEFPTIAGEPTHPIL